MIYNKHKNKIINKINYNLISLIENKKILNNKIK